jgi:hypothetical protein
VLRPPSTTPPEVCSGSFCDLVTSPSTGPNGWFTRKADGHAPRRLDNPHDLIGKLDMLRVDCAKCDRHGQYRVDSA